MDGNSRIALSRVIVFACAGTAAENAANGKDLAAAWHPEDSPFETEMILVPCSGKLQPEHLLKAFEAGADAVLLLTCRDGDCRYLEGRRRTERRVGYVRGLLDEIGLGGERLLLMDSTEVSHADRPWEALSVRYAHLTASPLGKNGGR
jgi:coenzyme F420-reducing hydrogenase delta subunit